ncbi:ArgE/DapE family deacylase [Lacticaseibacillus jixianensis]|uniref:Probable succinyl-diaminopimelate desuccinylase n=1 Tax=Lacticaseibacillus jixianensis TaxID=2486012 RepID=A0ABW4B7K4_9LACO|nr:ArgE/DapE family deacylase [Lacticaseibacillus jixianensis]
MDEADKFLQELVQIDTSTATTNESAVARVIQKKLAAAGIDSKLIPYAEGRDNLVAEFGDGQPIFVFTGHQDVVNTGDLSKWTYPPFAAHIENGRLYGRGASDMKSGLAAEVLAFIALKQSGFAHHVRLLLTIGEEYGAMGAQQLTDAGYADDIAAMLVGEPTAGKIEFGHAGSYNYKVKSYGKSAHSSLPALGTNAIVKLTDFILAERTLFDDVPVDPVIGPLVHSVTVLKAGDQVNTIPDYAELAGNIRPTPSFMNEKVTARLQEAVAKIDAAGAGNLKFELTHTFYPVLTPTDSKLVTRANEAIESVSGKKLALTISHGATDASDFTKSKNKFETIIYGPGDEDKNLSHQINEYVSLDRYHTVIKEYEAIVRHYFD